MAIVSINDTKGARGLSWSGQSGRIYTLNVRIVTDDATMGPRAVLKSLGLKNGDHYRFPLYANNVSNPNPTEYDWGSFVQSLDLKEEGDDGKQWIATLQYGPFDWTSQGGATGDSASDGVINPFAVPPKVRWSTVKNEKACMLDAAGTVILNTAGDPFDPPLKRDDSRPVLTIVRNEPIFNETLYNSFKDTTNSTQFLGYDVNTVKCNDITGDRIYNSDFGYYWEVTYEFELRPVTLDTPYGWTEQVLNAGMRQLSADGTAVEQIIIQNAPVSSPVPLNASGRYVPTGTPYYLQVRLYPMKDFAALGIPDDLLSVKSIPGQAGS